jgi:hypothetical protein
METVGISGAEDFRGAGEITTDQTFKFCGAAPRKDKVGKPPISTRPSQVTTPNSYLPGGLDKRVQQTAEFLYHVFRSTTPKLRSRLQDGRTTVV